MTSPTYSSTMRPMGSTWGQHQGFRPYGTTSGSITQLSPMAQQKQPERHAEDIFDEAAFERAFDAAKKEAEEYSLPKESTDVGSRENIDLRISAEEGLIQSDGGTTKHEQLERSHDLNDTSFDEFLYSADVQMHDELPMGPGMQNFDVDAFLASGTADDGDFETPNNLASTSTAQQEDRLRDEQEANELSYTAGQLLDNLKDEQSQKFKESSFLALMRQLRDKEVRVEGDKMVDVSKSKSPFSILAPASPASPVVVVVVPPITTTTTTPTATSQLESFTDPSIKHNHPGSPEFIKCRVMQCV